MFICDKDQIRVFLQAFKVVLCTNKECNDPNLCSNYHCSQQKRRNPYTDKFNEIKYDPVLCQVFEEHDREKCKLCHNHYEYYYHPLVFKTYHCPNYYECSNNFCPHFHAYDNKKMNEFFRFDLKTFKVYPCKKQYSHDKKICLFYHNAKDKRRPNFSDYEHVQCKENGCKSGQHCPLSHNKIQQLYHPSRYKSKFCEKYLLKKQCEYKNFCSFAHSKEQITIRLIEQLDKTAEFQVYEYKTVWCPLTIQHNRSQCVYAHNIQDFRRNPKKTNYLPEKCSKWKSNQNIKSIDEAGCPDKMKCKYCHGWKEYDYHPQIYGRRNHITFPQKPKETLKKEVNKLLQTSTTLISNKYELINEEKTKRAPNNKNRNLLYSNGAPFFKAESISEHCSKTTNTKSKTSKQFGLQKEKMSQMQQRGSIDDNFATQQDNQKIQISSAKMNILEEDDFFKYFKNQQPQSFLYPSFIYRVEDKKDRISQSCNNKIKSADKNYEMVYSQEVQEKLDQIIIEKIKINRINEIKLLNMGEEQVNKLQFLNTEEKQRMLQSIKLINNERHEKKLKYSKEFIDTFKKFNCQLLLRKMKQRNVSEKKLRALMEKQIQDFSFLTFEQKKMLPKILEDSDFIFLQVAIEQEVADT